MSNYDLASKSIGKYHILEPLGEGGVAIIHKAYDTILELNVAIKIIRIYILHSVPFDPDVSRQILMRFEHEAKVLGKLEHPNIVKVIDYGDFEGRPYSFAFRRV